MEKGYHVLICREKLRNSKCRRPREWSLSGCTVMERYTYKKENKTFLIYKEIQMGSGAKSYMRKGFRIYEGMHKFFPIYEEAVSLI
jgi:hypothetical protein